MNQKDRNKKKLPQQNKPIEIIGKSSNSRWLWYGLAIVVLTTFAIYFKAVKFDFIFNWDDQVYIIENNHVKDLYWANIKLFFTQFYVNNYQPLTMLFYALEYKIGGGNAFIFHLNNILLHIANSILVYILIRKISPKNAVVALITAAFFAVHP
ncbi:MAG: hypothetical protein HGB12_13800, partial [Bacteroidetes bacterium]|nr:hypothetical protein [Bacteroidota bacterium]